MRLLVKLATVNERSDENGSLAWSDTGDTSFVCFVTMCSIRRMSKDEMWWILVMYWIH